MKQVLLYRRDSISGSDLKKLEDLGVTTVALTATSDFIPHVIGVYSEPDFTNAAQTVQTSTQTN